jgi:hypothetical protein
MLLLVPICKIKPWSHKNSILQNHTSSSSLLATAAAAAAAAMEMDKLLFFRPDPWYIDDPAAVMLPVVSKRIPPDRIFSARIALRIIYSKQKNGIK